MRAKSIRISRMLLSGSNTSPTAPLSVCAIALLWVTLALAWSAGILGRGYWTPDEPREADIAWRMSWQPDKTVPLLAGEAFCEKPPLTYWVAGAAISWLGPRAWAARLPNLLYALLGALAVASLASRAAGPLAAQVAAAASATSLLSYQTAIWRATDAPLVAAVAVALLGLYRGFYATNRAQRLFGYTLMHAAMSVGFMCKSAAGWMVPVSAFAALVIWEKRWRELGRIELYAGLPLQAAVILSWTWLVYSGPDGPAHLRVFFWNNLIGRLTQLEAPDSLQYAAGHRNTPGKYLWELPAYLWPWTLLVGAAVRRAWRGRASWLPLGPAGGTGPAIGSRAVRFALASFLPTLLILSFAATARNIYLAPAMPGVALLLGWWVQEMRASPDRYDRFAMRLTAYLLFAAAAAAAAAVVVGLDAWPTLGAHALYVTAASIGIAAGAALAWVALARIRRAHAPAGLFAMLLGYCALLIGPATQIYRGVDTWQDLASIGRAIRGESGGRPLILLAPDETTRAMTDLYVRTAATVVPGPVEAAAIGRVRELVTEQPDARILTQLPGRQPGPMLQRWSVEPPEEAPPNWLDAAGLRIIALYALPNGRRYALLAGAAGADPRR